ncbi:MAG: NifB/NifX family molybdenum-iron cluster-binding protein [Bacteroides sp.]
MTVKIAIPTENGKLCAHFGHCEAFYMATITEGSITDSTMIVPPAHEPGLYPAWVAQHGVKTVIAGGMGQKARDLFAKEQVEVIVGAPFKAPEELVHDFIQQTLVVGNNSCNHK